MAIVILHTNGGGFRASSLAARIPSPAPVAAPAEAEEDGSEDDHAESVREEEKEVQLVEQPDGRKEDDNDRVEFSLPTPFWNCTCNAVCGG